jgi:hypothetical protein
MFVAVIMAEKMTYKKRKKIGCTTGYKLHQVRNSDAFCLLVKSKNQV